MSVKQRFFVRLSISFIGCIMRSIGHVVQLSFACIVSKPVHTFPLRSSVFQGLKASYLVVPTCIEKDIGYKMSRCIE